jgi:hypothetical protein
MLTATVEIQYVNPPKPGKKMGSIKTKDGTYYNVWPDKLHLFQPGQTQMIEYQERSNGSGGKFLTAVGVVNPAQVQMPASDNFQASGSPAKPWPGPQQSRKSVQEAHKDEMIFVMNQAAAAIRAGQIVVGSPEYIPFINKLRSAYSATFGADEEAV